MQILPIASGFEICLVVVFARRLRTGGNTALGGKATKLRIAEKVLEDDSLVSGNTDFISDVTPVERTENTLVEPDCFVSDWVVDRWLSFWETFKLVSDWIVYFVRMPLAVMDCWASSKMRSVSGWSGRSGGRWILLELEIFLLLLLATTYMLILELTEVKVASRLEDSLRW